MGNSKVTRVVVARKRERVYKYVWREEHVAKENLLRRSLD